LSTWRVAGAAFVLALILVVAYAGWALNQQHLESPAEVRPQDKTMLAERTNPPDPVPAASLPSEDTPGRDAPDLPRYPDSVRVEYERKELDALILTRARYLSAEKVDTVRGFYRGVFRSEDWKVANAEFSDHEWTFLVVKGELEAEIEVRAHATGSETDMRLSAPRSSEQTNKEAASEASPPEREAAPEPTASPTPATASPASTATAPPSYVSPAPAPDGYEFEEDDPDDFEGGDD
jgi:hypothetical protein